MYQPAKNSIHDLIAARAYEVWENQGRPHGRDVVNWHQAEQEIQSSLGPRSNANKNWAAGLPDLPPRRIIQR